MNKTHKLVYETSQLCTTYHLNKFSPFLKSTIKSESLLPLNLCHHYLMFVCTKCSLYHLHNATIAFKYLRSLLNVFHVHNVIFILYTMLNNEMNIMFNHTQIIKI